MRIIARRLLPVVEKELGLVTFPDQNTCWHFDDKIAQSYLFQAHKIPAPKTWVWYDRTGAVTWASSLSERGQAMNVYRDGKISG